MTSVHQGLRLSRRLRPYLRTIQRQSNPSKSWAVRSFASSSPLNHATHQDEDPTTLSLIDNIDLDNNPTVLAISSHNPAHEIPWWDASIYATDIVHAVHDMTGMPYAASIAAVTVLGRIVMVPIAIWHLRNNPWEPHLLEIRTLFDKANNPSAKARYRAEIESITRQFPRINRFALPLASLGTTLFMWVGLRRMASLYPTEMMTGGVAWFIDLTQPDPYLFLPILSNFLLYTVNELGADETGRPHKQIQNRVLRYSWRGLTVCLFGMWFFLPSSILCFWIPHSALSCLQTVVFSQPAVIQQLGFGRGGQSSVSKKQSTDDQSISYYHEATNSSKTSNDNGTNGADRSATGREDSKRQAAAATPIRIKRASKKSARRKK